MVKRLCSGLMLSLGILLLAVGAQAGGLYLYELGSPDVGLAAAGYAARAQDASTAFSNPAGMTRLKQSQLQVGAQPMYLHVKFDPSAETTTSGKSGDATAWMPAAGTFIVTPLTPDVSLGFSVAGNFGLGLDYGDDWVGRYYLKDVLMQGVTLAPAVAWRINEQVSIGASLNAMYGILEENVAVNNGGAFADGELNIEDEDWGFGGTFGVLVEPQPGTRFGATYMTKTDLDFESKAKFTGLRPVLANALGAPTIKLPLEVPQAVMLSAFHQVNDRLAIMGNLGWQDWSEFGKIDVTVASENTLTKGIDRQYQDTWHAALGAQYQLSEPWLLSAGVAYDSEMVEEKDMTPDLPTGASWRFGLGGQYAWSKALTVNCAYELNWIGDLSMDVERGPLAGRVTGDYDSMAIHVVVLGLNWNF